MTSRGPVFWGMRRWVALLWLLCAGGLAAEEFRTFSLESGEVLLERAAPSASAFLRAFRSNPATGRWEVDVVVTNGTPDRLQPPVILRFERAGGVAPGIGGAALDAEGLPFLDLTVRGAVSGMDPGTALPAFTLQLGDGRTRPDLEVAVYSRPPPGLAVVRTLDAAGLPVEGVTVREVGPGTARSKVSGRGGWVTVEGRPEVVGWEFSLPGRVPAFRSVAGLVPRQVVELPSVRMIPADPTGTTVLSVEALPVLLPAGWSPMAAAVAGPGTLALTATAPLPVGREAAWVRWEPAGRVWRLRERVVGTGAAVMELSVADPGLHVLAVPDPDGPELPGPGGVVAGVTIGLGVPEGLEAVGEVTPPVRAASRVAEQVTTRATVRLTSQQGPLSSGLAIPCEVVEEYRLRDGSRRVLPSYGMVLVGYRETGDEVPGRLTSRFPLRPFQLLDGEELLEAVVRVEVLGPGAFVSGVVGADGGRVGLEGIEWTIPAGVMAGPEAVRLRIPGLGQPSEWAPPGLVVERAVELVVGAPVAGGEMRLGFGPLPAASRFVLARAVFDDGRHGFQPVARFSTDEGGAGTFDEPAAGPRLPGVDGGGQYVLFRVGAPEGLVAGVARDAAGQPQPGLMVRRGPWTAFSGADGSYRLLAPAGPGDVTLLDPRTGDSGVASVDVSVGTPLLTADVQAGAAGPRVVRVSPPDGSADVAVVTAVDIRFSRSLDPSTVGADGVVLLGAGGAPVTASLRLSLDGLSVQLLPEAPLAGGVEHRIRVADRVRDREGRALEGIAEFGFTTRAFVLDRGLAGQVTVYEPGATNLTEAVRSRVPAYDPERDGDGVVIEGSQGTAEPDGVVILVNESTGETATTRAEIDGSFVGLIRGDVNDFISAVLVNANGTRNQLPATRQRFDDGTVGLFGSGGTIRSTGDGVPVDLIVEPGSVPGKTLFKLESLPTATFGQLVEGRLPEGAGPILGAFELTESGDPLSAAADISVPFKLADIGLPPGELPDDVSFLVVMPLRVDGRVVHQIVDTATYEPEDAEGGRLRTASPPFVGMLVRKLAALARSAGMSVVTTPKVASNNDNPHKGETAVFGILPMIARGPLKVGGFARVVTRNADGTPTIVGSLPGATVRVMKLVDDQDPDTAALEFDGDLVSISDERGNFGFFYRPSEANETRMLFATHPRFPFQRPRTGAFVGERRGTTVVNADLMFVELPPDLAAVDDIAPPQVTVGHTPDLPRAGSGEGSGADLFVVGVDDREVGPPRLEVVRVENLRGETLDVANPLTVGQLVGNEPARKVMRYRLAIPVPGRVILQASVADATGKEDIAAHSVSFGVTRPPVEPGDPADTIPLRVTFAWPPEGGTNLPALTPVRLRFNRSLPAALIATPPYDWLTFSSGHFVRRVEADSDRRELTVYYDGPASGPVRLTVGPGITGESGRAFDQRSDEDESQPFALSFQQAVAVTELLEGGSGAGAALLGRFAYTLEREGNGGRLQVWDLEDPADPRSVRNIRVGYPTAMALIPGQSLPTETNHLGEILSVCVPMNLLAVFTGHANEPKYLQLGRIDGSRLQFGPRLILSGGGIDGDGLPSVAEGVTEAESISQIVKAKWDPPYLGYYELGADVTSVKLIDLHAYWLVEREDGVLDRFGAGSLGVDANGDGDYCDSGDRAPSPRRDPLQPPGMAFSFAPSGARERWDDFDFHAGLGLVVTVGRFLDGQTAPRFNVVLAAAQGESLEDAFVEFPAGEFLRRVLLLPATTVERGGQQVSRDLALVSISRGGGADGALAVIDLTTPSAPVLVNRFDLPAGEGAAGSAQLRPDGLLAVVSGRSTLLFDPSQLLQPAVEGTPPGLVGRIDGTGTGVRDFVSDPSGVHLTFGGATRRYVEAPPRFSFIRFNAPINPEVVAAQGAAIAEGFLRSGSPVRAADVLQSGNGTNPPPVDPARHYYVLVDAPGGAADSNGRLPLVLSAVDSNGMPQRERGGTVVPAVVGDEQLYSALLGRRVIETVLGVISVKKALTSISEAAGLVERAQAALKAIKSAKKLIPKLTSLGKALQLLPDDFVARRLSDDPNHPLYNRFLAGPFVVLGGAPTVEQLTALRDQAAAMEVDRVYLRPSSRLWVGLPSERAEALLTIPTLGDPPPSRLPSFVSELRLNPSLSVAGFRIPLANELIEQMAGVNQLPGNPLSFFDMGEQVTLIVSLVSQVPLVGKVLKGDWQPMLLPGAHEILRVNHTERPMVLVPGFAASRLEINGANHWLGLPQTQSELASSVVNGEGVPLFLDRERKDLRVNPDGSPVRETFPTDILRFTLDVPIELGSIYGNWVNHLTGELGFVEYKFKGSGLGPAGPQVRDRLRLDGKPGLGQSPTPNLFLFPYDWRLDNQKAAEALREYVRLVLEIHPDADGIDLVGHSNGGLVSRAYMLLPGQRSRVKRLITVGTPWLGAPKPLSGLKTGNLDDLDLNRAIPIPAVRKVLQFAPGAHQLLPSREYFDLGFRPLVEDGYDINTNGLPNEAFDFDGYQEVLARHFLRGPVEEMLNEPGPGGEMPEPRRSIGDLPGGEHPVRRNANGFRLGQPIGDHRGDTVPDVEMHHIVGFGATPDTIGQLRVRARLVPVDPVTNVVASVARVTAFDSEQVEDGPPLLNSPGDGTLAVNPTNQFRLNEEIEVRYVAGDGTVPIASLARGFGSGASLNAPHARVHALVGGDGQEITEHNPMLNTEEFFHVFDTVYAGRALDEITVSATAGGGFSEGSLGTLSVSGSLPAGGSGAISFVADFGDGAVELRQGSGGSAVFQHRYRQSGTYLVTVGAAAAGPVYGLSSVSVTVANVPPTVTIDGGDLTVNRGDTRVLVAQVTDPGLDDRHTLTWELPSGNASGPGPFAMPVTFDEPGDQVVTVRVRDSDGAEGSATITVTVLPDPPALAGPNFGADPAAGRAARPATIPGFDGGHPELIVRVNGHAPDALDTVGISVMQEGAATELAGMFFDAVFGEPGNQVLDVIQRVFIPRAARFLGRLASDGGSEYARVLRDLPLEIGGADFAATRALVGARGTDGPIEVDALYLQGGVPRVLRRWVVPHVAASEGVRLTFDWNNFTEGRLERVTPDSGSGSPLRGSPIETLEPAFSAFSEQAAGDRQGPGVAGILNPATQLVTLLGRDNLTPADRLRLFAVFDANENDRLDDDLFYPLDTNVVAHGRLPERPYAVVAMDEQGNLGGIQPLRLAETRNFLVDRAPGLPESEYERQLKAVRTVVREAIEEARTSPLLVGRFLLDPSHLWIFEQGSGANLWKPDFVRRCNGVYLPGQSDNDYELFLPVHLDQPYPFTEEGRRRFEEDGPHTAAMLQGDWYFLRPVPADSDGNELPDAAAATHWLYRHPASFALESGVRPTLLVPRLGDDRNLALGQASPLTPAEVIARVFTSAVTDNPARRAVLKDTTFFPERREHFQFGRLHLQRPPPFGDDPIGDAGTGRQMLLLKWLLEGAYVTLSDEAGGDGLNADAPALADIFANWLAAGVPLAEGFEWGLFQDFAALKARPFQDAELADAVSGGEGRLRREQASIDDAIQQQQAARIKKLGKAAIRATLARLAGDTGLNGAILTEGSTSMGSAALRSYEHFILDLARSSEETRAVFGEFADDRDDRTEPPDLGDFLRAKNGDRDYLTTVLFAPGAYQRFVEGTFRFLRDVVQRPTAPTHAAYMGDLRSAGRFDELTQRSVNLDVVLRGRGDGKPGLIDLNEDASLAPFQVPVSVEVYSDGDGGTVEVTLSRSEDGGSGGTGSERRAALSAGSGRTVLATVAATRDDDETVNDGDPTDPGTTLLAGGATASRVEGTVEADVADGIETRSDDNSARIAVAAVPRSGVPEPVAVGPLNEIEGLFLHPSGSQEVTSHPADADLNLAASPGRLLRTGDRLFLRYLGTPGAGAGDLVVSVDDGQPDPRVYLMEEREGQPGVYTPPDGIPVEDLAVVEEQPVRFQVLREGSVVAERTFVLDRFDVAGAGIDIFYRRSDQQLVPFVRDTMGGRIAGDDNFPDDWLNSGQLLPLVSRWEAFVRNAGAQDPAIGQADLLILSSHGSEDGTLEDDNDTLIFNPADDSPNGIGFGGPSTWSLDVDWVLLASCLQLSPDQGAVQWRQAFNGPRPPHGVLGAFRPIPADMRGTYRSFLQRLHEGFEVLDTYRAAMEGAGLSWAVLFQEGTDRDRLIRMRPDTVALPPGGLRFLRGGLTAPVVCGRDDRGQEVAPLGRDLADIRVRPAVRLRSGPAFTATSPAALAGRLRRVEGDVARWVPSRTVIPARSDATAVNEAAGQFLGRELPGAAAHLVLEETAPQIEGTWDAQDRYLERTNSWTLGYLWTIDDVPVWRSRWIVHVGSDGVRDTMGSLHVEEPVEGPVIQGVRPVGPDAALKSARPVLENRGWSGGRVLATELLYADRTALGGASPAAATGLRTVNPLWRVTVDIDPSEDGRVREYRYLWVDAVTGEFVEVTTD